MVWASRWGLPLKWRLESTLKALIAGNLGASKPTAGCVLARSRLTSAGF
jgi:hypothetical protein